MAIRRDFTDVHSAALGLPVDIGSNAYSIAVRWAGAAGANKAEVTQASATLSPASVIETHAGVSPNSLDDGKGWAVDIPSGKRLSALTLHGFKQPGQDEIVSGLPDGTRITLAFTATQGQGFDAPRFALPPLNGHDRVPPTLAGARLSNRVLQLSSAVDAKQVLISLVTGDAPGSFSSQQTELKTVDVTTDTPARNAKFADPNGSAVWQTPMFDSGGPDATVDFRAPLEAALNQQLSKHQAAEATFTLSADSPAQVYISLAGPNGALVRAEKGVIRTNLEGDPLALGLSAELAEERPASVVGDLTVKYQGIRILEAASDLLPGAGDAIRGTVVRSDGVVRAVPAGALDQCKPARIGIFGRAPEDCELSIEFVRMVGTEAGEVLAAPTVLTLKKSESLASSWGQVPKGTAAAGAAGVRVRANRGRYFWVNNASGSGILRIAIFDSDPGNRPLTLGGVELLAVSAPVLNLPGFTFPSQLFQGSAPAFDSDLFLATDCADLTLRYAR